LKEGGGKRELSRMKARCLANFRMPVEFLPEMKKKGQKRKGEVRKGKDTMRVQRK